MLIFGGDFGILWEYYFLRFLCMKKIAKKITGFFADKGGSDTARVNDAANGSSAARVNDAVSVSETEINRRIDMAAKHTVTKYGHIIERLAKE